VQIESLRAEKDQFVANHEQAAVESQSRLQTLQAMKQSDREVLEKKLLEVQQLAGASQAELERQNWLVTLAVYQ